MSTPTSVDRPQTRVVTEDQHRQALCLQRQRRSTLDAKRMGVGSGCLGPIPPAVGRLCQHPFSPIETDEREEGMGFGQDRRCFDLLSENALPAPRVRAAPGRAHTLQRVSRDASRSHADILLNPARTTSVVLRCQMSN